MPIADPKIGEIWWATWPMGAVRYKIGSMSVEQNPWVTAYACDGNPPEYGRTPFIMMRLESFLEGFIWEEEAHAALEEAYVFWIAEKYPDHDVSHVEFEEYYHGDTKYQIELEAL